MATDGERIAVLETKVTALETRLGSIEGKLDQLLELKSKGMGALSLVGLLLGSGIIGVILTVVNLFGQRSHL